MHCNSLIVLFCSSNSGFKDGILESAVQSSFPISVRGQVRRLYSLIVVLMIATSGGESRPSIRSESRVFPTRAQVIENRSGERY